MGQLPAVTDPAVLVGTATADDAAVYRIGDDLAIVQTVDFFTPVVDDPYEFGRITAANSLSDVYAMGAKPLFALNIVGFPAGALPLEYLQEILRGGADKAAEAGIPIIGGHTIRDPEPKYGLSVTGTVHPDSIVTNAGGKPGDKLILTKPLGIGIITTGLKKGVVSAETEREAVSVMAELNRAAAEAMIAAGAGACTDVTGFGLLGHLHEMAKGSGTGAAIRVGTVPVLAEAWNLVRQGIVPGGTRKNLDYLRSYLLPDESVSAEDLLVLADAQTSGGLLIAIAPENAELLRRELEQRRVAVIAEVGELTADAENRIRIMA